MDIKIGPEGQQQAINKVNQLEHRMRVGQIITPKNDLIKKKIQPIMIKKSNDSDENYNLKEPIGAKDIS